MKEKDSKNTIITKFSIGEEVIFIYNNSIYKGKIKEINISLNIDKIKIEYKFDSGILINNLQVSSFKVPYRVHEPAVFKNIGEYSVFIMNSFENYVE